MSDGDSSARVSRSAATNRVDAIRAGVVVVLFVVALALLLGPASNLVASTTPTTSPRHHFPVVHPRDVTVQVANGTSVQGLAHAWTQLLLTLNWAALPATSATYHPTATMIYFKPGQQAAGKLLAEVLHVPHANVLALGRLPAGTVAGATTDDVVIVIGRHHHGEGVAG